jgi:hypothetical protein
MMEQGTARLAAGRWRREGNREEGVRLVSARRVQTAAAPPLLLGFNQLAGEKRTSKREVKGTWTEMEEVTKPE